MKKNSNTVYSLCFIFNSDLSHVLTIKKERPKWQKGFLNGIGGKMEKNETFMDTTRREVYEECGIDLSLDILKHNVKYVGIFESFDYTVFITTVRIADNIFYNYKSKTDEEIIPINVNTILNYSNKFLRSVIPTITLCKQKLTDNTLLHFKAYYDD